MPNMSLQGIIAKPRKFVVFDLAFIILLIAAVVAIVFVVRLTKENARLKAALSDVSGTLAGPQSAEVDDIVPGFKTTDLAQRPTEIVYDGSTKSLIFIFSPTCGTCVVELPNWNRIASEALGLGYTVRGISLDPLDASRKNLASKNISFDILIMPDRSIQRAYRVVSVPEVLLVSGQGRIDWVHYGAMTEQTVEELLGKIRGGL
jgi:peroxiredoxin